MHIFGVVLLLCMTARCSAQAGPPYQTDDPDPVPYHHFEAYVFELSDTTTAGTALSAPSYEMNWGAAPNLQLHLVVPFTSSLTPDDSAQHGVGDIELGAKYRLVKEAKYVPEIGVFPFVELPAGDAARGLGVGKTWYRLPVWRKKGFGSWNIFGGGGEVLVSADGYRNYPFSGFLLQRKITEKLTLGAELFGHGMQNPGPDGVGHSIMADFGGYYSFSDHFQLMCAAGHSVVWKPETYTYFAAYWTWGKDAQKISQPGNARPFYPAHN